MGLFDDLIKKPVNQDASLSTVYPNSSEGATMTPAGNASAATGTGVPIFIEKTSEQTIFGPNTESQNIDKENAVSAEPTVHAEEDASSILMSPSEMVNTTNNLSLAASPAGEGQVPPSGNVTVNTVTIPGMNPGGGNDFDIKNLGAQSGLTSNTISINPTQSPLQNLVSTTQFTNGGTPEPNPASGSIFDSIMSKTEESQATPNLVDPISADLASETAPNVAEIMGNTPPVDASHDFSTPREFIEKNLVSIDTMMANIDKRHEAKIREAEGYKAEKLRFTELEKSAYSEASIMDRERDHALHMKNILEAELERDTANRNPKSEESKHVESSLSEIGTEHAINHRHSHKKHEAAPEEDIFAAS